MIGFSAGGIATIGVLLEGEASARPNFAVPAYALDVGADVGAGAQVGGNSNSGGLGISGNANAGAKAQTGAGALAAAVSQSSSVAYMVVRSHVSSTATSARVRSSLNCWSIIERRSFRQTAVDRHGPILSVPYSIELNDSPALVFRQQAARDFERRHSDLSSPPFAVDAFNLGLGREHRHVAGLAVQLDPGGRVRTGGAVVGGQQRLLGPGGGLLQLALDGVGEGVQGVGLGGVGAVGQVRPGAAGIGQRRNNRRNKPCFGLASPFDDSDVVGAGRHHLPMRVGGIVDAQ